ncbi:hypothetical protein [Devosia psychrophila]|jgi:hypothetical protein|uniref:DUF1127 domain-containing protein n=1 Tax=Devosia psychrophila TaxID=728005 RepID=A0A0F5PYU0_9HYPH|nr:hypothetical protein [Devosia psychrophila]KKC33775.1 hypothetical protein WH91_06445 [Devosia psychrophila]SFC45747.1 hypothetical protein SAMN04488059_105137 [Devosia psychrophila]
MNIIAKPLLPAIHLPRWSFPRLFSAAHRRRQVTIDLIHSSPHLLRDIGLIEDRVVERRR